MNLLMPSMNSFIAIVKLSLNTNQNDVIVGLGNRFTIVIIAIIIAWFARVILIRFMNHWMMSKSKKAQPDIINQAQFEEISTTKDINFKVFDSESKLEGISAPRTKLVNQAKQSMKRQYITDLVIILVYVIVGLYLYGDAILGSANYMLIYGENSEELYAETLKRCITYFLFLSLFLVWNTMRLIGYRHQFQAYRKGLFGSIAPFWKLLFTPFQTRWCLVLAAIVLINAFVPAFFSALFGSFSEGLVALSAVIFHLFMIYKLKTKARKRPNLKLLILRVFLINKTSLFTFSRLAKFWKHFGSYFTVADPSFYRVYWKRKFNHKFPVFILIIFFIYTKFEDATSAESGSEPLFAVFIFLIFIGAVFFIIYSIGRMKRNFVSNEKVLNKDLSRLSRWPVKLDNTFKEKPVSCYDNTWQMTVYTLINSANVVLMDLRGFSEKNKGCEYEVDLLLDKVDINKILFLVYPDALSLIKEMINRKYKTLQKGSPNLLEDNPKVKVFIIKKEDNKETQAIIDILLESAMYY